MKKLLLLLAGGFVATGVNAQSLKQAAGGAHIQPKTHQDCTSTAKVASRKKSAARTTATCFYTEDFGTGTNTSLPTGWTAGTVVGGTWRWRNTASNSAFSMGAMNSTTAANGWMIFDSDSIGNACGPTCTPIGWLQSPAINCASHSTVRLTFEDYYRKYLDSSSIWVGTDPSFASGTYHVYPVAVNNNTPHNGGTANPVKVMMNITGMAGGASTVYLRFYSYGAAYGSYSWMIDDICISELDPHDVSVSNSILDLVDVGTGTTAYNGTYNSIPLQYVDSVLPLTFVSNWGANIENVNLSLGIWRSGTSVFTDNITYSGLGVDAFDSVAVFAPYKPTATGSYAVRVAASVTGDVVSSNDVDSLFFTVTDTIWQNNAANRPLGSAGLYSNAIGTTPITTRMHGTRFDVPSTITTLDTVSGFGVAFASSSVPTGGGTVTVQLYSIDETGTSWNYLGTSKPRTITAADIPTAGNVIWTDFRIDQLEGTSQFILQPGFSYAAMIQLNGVNSVLNVLTTEANPMAPGYIGYLGQSDTSENAGGQDFGLTQATGDAVEVPMVRMYLGNIPSVGVENVTYANLIGQAYPNPANTSVNIPFTTGVSTSATITLSNAIGQVIKTQQISTVGGKQATASFSTADLAAGVYLYTVEANGQATTGRVSVTH